MSFIALVNHKVFSALVFGGFLLLLSGCGKTNAAPAAPPLPVQVATVVQQDTPIYSEWVAILDGFVNAQIQPRVSGYIIKQNYREGSVVNKGQVLFEIDPRPFKAALDQAKAQLAQAEAQFGKAKLDVERDTPLAQAQAIAHIEAPGRRLKSRPQRSGRESVCSELYSLPISSRISRMTMTNPRPPPP